jgi:hypothetical protein
MMSITHEQLKKNVEVSRKRLQTTHERRALWVKRHGTQRKIAVGAAAVWTFNVVTMFIFYPAWVGLIFLFLMAGTFGMSLEGMANARKGIKRAAEDERVQLSDVVDDIQALVDRETLALMNPERYAELERPDTIKDNRVWDRPSSKRKAEQDYRRVRARREAERKAKYAERQRAITRRNASLTGYRAEYRRYMARELAVQAGIPRNMLTNNGTVSYTKIMPDDTVIKETINLDTGEVQITW